MNESIESWKRACELLGKEIGERLLIWVNEISANYKTGAAAPTIKLKMEAAPAGDLPLVTIGINIPKAGLKDESEIDLNQLKLFDKEDDL